MSSFCKDCSIAMFGEDFKELAGIAEPGSLAVVLCEGGRQKSCPGGYIVVDEHGVKQADFYVCSGCGEVVDKRDLAQVFAHEHKGLPLDGTVGIEGIKKS